MIEIFGVNLKMRNPVPEGKTSFPQLEELLKGYEKLGIGSNEDTQVIVFAPHTYLDYIATSLRKNLGIRFNLGAQGCSEYNSGHNTAQMSPGELKELGVTHVLIESPEINPKSNLRKMINKTMEIDYKENRKMRSAIQQGLNVIYCIGEAVRQPDSMKRQATIKRQIREGVFGLSRKELERLIIAYCPRWVRQSRDNQPESEIEETHSMIRFFMNYETGSLRKNISVIYGGSVSSVNAKQIMAIPGVNGALVKKYLFENACLKPEEFAKIVHYKTA